MAVLKQSFETKRDTLKTASFCALCAVVSDCALSGGGRWLALGPISLRMALFAAAFVCAAPAMLKSAKVWLKNPMAVSFALFALYLAVCAARGLLAGNRTDVLISDLKGYAWLALIPVALAAADTPARVETLMKCAAYASSLLALFAVALNVALISGANAKGIGEWTLFVKWGFVDNVTDTMYRVFMSSGPYMAAGCAFFIYFQVKRKRFSWLYAALAGLMLCALLLTFTRSLYLAAAAAIIPAAVLSFFYAPGKRKRLIAQAALSAAFAFALVFAQQAASGSDYMRFALARTFSQDIVSQSDMNDPKALSGAQGMKLRQEQEYLERTKISDNSIRQTTLKELNELIRKAPVFGSGLGAAVKCREDGLVEYFYYDIIAKTGLAGLALYLFPAAYMAYALLRGRDGAAFPIKAAWYAALLAFLSATYFNPYMNASLGITCYAAAAACFSLKERHYAQRNRFIK